MHAVCNHAADTEEIRGRLVDPFSAKIQNAMALIEKRIRDKPGMLSHLLLWRHLVAECLNSIDFIDHIQTVLTHSNDCSVPYVIFCFSKSRHTSTGQSFSWLSVSPASAYQMHQPSDIRCLSTFHKCCVWWKQKCWVKLIFISNRPQFINSGFRFCLSEVPMLTVEIPNIVALVTPPMERGSDPYVQFVSKLKRHTAILESQDIRMFFVVCLRHLEVMSRISVLSNACLCMVLLVFWFSTRLAIVRYKCVRVHFSVPHLYTLTLLLIRACSG